MKVKRRVMGKIHARQILREAKYRKKVMRGPKNASTDHSERCSMRQKVSHTGRNW